MSQMKVSPVFSCRNCGRPVVAQLKTAVPDKDGALLHELMAGLEKIAYCDDCLAKVNWYNSQNRGDEITGIIRPTEGRWRKKPVLK